MYIMNYNKYFILIGIIISILLLGYKSLIFDNYEHYGVESINSEALQNLSSMYKDDKLIGKSAAIANDITIGNKNKWSIAAMDDSTTLSITPWDDSKPNPEKNIVFHNEGKLCIRNQCITLDSVNLLNTIVNYSRTMEHYMYPPSDSIIYQSIFSALDKGAIKKLGSPQYDAHTHKTNLWNNQQIIKFGKDNEQDGNGAEIIIPQNKTTTWIRVLGERWTAFNVYYLDGIKERIGLFAGGYKKLNGISPDGACTDAYWDIHQWVPIPTHRSGKIAIIPKPSTNGEFWLSGLAFSTNPWNHAMNSAVAYHWGLNGGTKLSWNSHEWNNDQLAAITQNGIRIMMVPVIPSKRDKLLYIVEHNANWTGTMHLSISVEDQPIERLRTTYSNPFATHFNSKQYTRYIAARIPQNLIKVNTRMIKVSIDMSKQNNAINFREMGTHDFFSL